MSIYLGIVNSVGVRHSLGVLHSLGLEIVRGGHSIGGVLLRSGPRVIWG